MKTFRIVIVDELGSHTADIRSRDMMEAIDQAKYKLTSRNPYSISSVTATTLSTSI